MRELDLIPGHLDTSRNHWLQPAIKYETVGIGILKLKFVPGPDAWLTLAAGVALLGAAYRRRAR